MTGFLSRATSRTCCGCRDRCVHFLNGNHLRWLAEHAFEVSNRMRGVTWLDAGCIGFGLQPSPQSQCFSLSKAMMAVAQH